MVIKIKILSHDNKLNHATCFKLEHILKLIRQPLSELSLGYASQITDVTTAHRLIHLGTDDVTVRYTRSTTFMTRPLEVH